MSAPSRSRANKQAEEAKPKAALYEIQLSHQIDAVLKDFVLVVIFVSTTTCAPCKRFFPHFEALAKKYQRRQDIAFVYMPHDRLQFKDGAEDIDNPLFAKVRSYPTFQAYFRGKLVDHVVGAKEQEFDAMVHRLLERSARPPNDHQSKAKSGHGSDVPVSVLETAVAGSLTHMLSDERLIGDVTSRWNYLGLDSLPFFRADAVSMFKRFSDESELQGILMEHGKLGLVAKHCPTAADVAFRAFIDLCNSREKWKTVKAGDFWGFDAWYTAWLRASPAGLDLSNENDADDDDNDQENDGDDDDEIRPSPENDRRHPNKTANAVRRRT